MMGTIILGVLLVLCVFYALILRSEVEEANKNMLRKKDELITERTNNALLEEEYIKIEEQKKEIQLLLIKERMNNFYYNEKVIQSLEKIFSNLTKAQEMIEHRIETSEDVDYIEVMALLNDSRCKIEKIEYYYKEKEK